MRNVVIDMLYLVMEHHFLRHPFDPDADWLYTTSLRSGMGAKHSPVFANLAILFIVEQVLVASRRDDGCLLWNLFRRHSVGDGNREESPNLYFEIDVGG